MSENHENTEKKEITENQEPEIDLEKRQFLKKNFFFVNQAKFPSWWGKYIQIAYFSIGFSIFFISYFNFVFVTVLVSSIGMLIGIWATYKWIRPYLDQKAKFSERPTEDQMEAWLIQEIKKDVKPKAIEMLSLNASRLRPENFLIVPHPIYWHTGGIEDEHIVRLLSSKDYYIYASYKIQVLALTENYVSLYTCNYDWLNNQVISENTNEFFFDDISSIKHGAEHISLKRIDFEPSDDEEDTGEIGAAQAFTLKNMSGEALSVITEIGSLQGSPRIAQKLDKLIQVLRITLRNRRYGETFEIIRPEGD